ncbi:hypothetical protein [Ruegeria sp. SCSIO 43209]|nr:hypothetical protein [Ruegeria sp. SCSIO 43209]
MIDLAGSDDGLWVCRAHPIDRRSDVVVRDVGALANDHGDSVGVCYFLVK